MLPTWARGRLPRAVLPDQVTAVPDQAVRASYESRVRAFGAGNGA